MFEYNNETLTLEELQEVAELKGVEFDTFYNDGLREGSIVEKTKDVTTQGAPVTSQTTAPESTDLGSETTSSELPKIDLDPTKFQATRVEKNVEDWRSISDKINVENKDVQNSIAGNYFKIGKLNPEQRSDYGSVLEYYKGEGNYTTGRDAATAAGLSAEEMTKAYMDYQGKGVLNIDSVPEDIKQSAINKVKTKQWQDFAGSIDPTELEMVITASKNKYGNLAFSGINDPNVITSIPEIEIEDKLPSKYNETKDILSNLKSTIRGIDINSEETKEEAVNAYFKMDNFEAWSMDKYGKTYNMQGEAIVAYPKFTADFDGQGNVIKSVGTKLLEQIESDREEYLGREKYVQWAYYTKGLIPSKTEEDFQPFNWRTDIPLTDIVQAIQTAKSKQAEIYLGKIDDDDQQAEVLKLMYRQGVAPDWVQEEIADRKNDERDYRILTKDFWNPFGKKLKEPTVIDGRTFKPLGGRNKFKTIADGVSKRKSEYLASKSFEHEVNDNRIKQELAELDKQVGKYPALIETKLAEIKEIEETVGLDRLKKGLAAKPVYTTYNKLIEEVKSLEKELDASNVYKIIENLTGRIENNNILADELNEIISNSDLDVATLALRKDYNNWVRTLKAIEKDYVYPVAVTVASAIDSVKGLGKIATNMMYARADVLQGADYSLEERVIEEGIQKQEDFERDMAARVALTWENPGLAIENMFSDAAPSILAVTTAYLNPALAKASIFAMGYGGKLVDVERQKRDAEKFIPLLKENLSLAKNEADRFAIEQDIEMYNNYLNASGFGSRISGTFAGGIELVGETFGSLRAIQNFSQWAKVSKNASVWRKSYAMGRGLFRSNIVENVEEVGVQVGNNIWDKFTFDSRVGVFDGLNTVDFYAQNTITGLAIQGPNLGKTTYSIISHEFKTRREDKADRELIQKIDAIDQEYSQLDGRTKRAKQLQKQKIALIEEKAFNEAINIDKLNNLTPEELAEVIELNRKLQNASETLNEFGASGRYGDDMSNIEKQNLQDTKDEYNALLETRERILNKNHDQVVEETQGRADQAEIIVRESKRKFFNNLAKMMTEKSGKLYTEVTQEDMDSDNFWINLASRFGIRKGQVNYMVATSEEGEAVEIDGREVAEMLDISIVKEDGTNKTEEELYNDILDVSQQLGDDIANVPLGDGRTLAIFEAVESFKNEVMNANALNVAGDVYVFTDNQKARVMLPDLNGGTVEADVASVAGVHEAFHSWHVEKGLVKIDEKGGKVVVESVATAIESIKSYLKLNNPEALQAFEDRAELYTTYDREGNIKDVNVEEMVNALGDLMLLGYINKSSLDNLFSLKYAFNNLTKFFADAVGIDSAGMFMPFKTGEDLFNYISNFNRKALAGRAITTVDREDEPVEKLFSAGAISPQAQQYLDLDFDNESLVSIINSRSSKAEERFGGVQALIEKNWPVISNAITFNPTGEISMDAIKTAIAEQMQGIFPEVTLKDGTKKRRGNKRLLDTYDGTKKVTTFLSATLRPRRAELLARGRQIDAATRNVGLDKATGIQDDSAQPFAEESSTYQKAKPKINILKDFTGVQEDKIVSLAKPAEGDTFKQIIKKYAGRAGQLVFGIPAKKIMEGGANLVPTTKIKEGMAVPSEALQIQRFFGAAQNLGNFVKTLPLYNVTEMTADINRQGENIEVSRDTYGIAIGLKGLPLDYFYESFTDPTGVMTSPKGRSKGLTSQTPVKKLKQKFRKPTKEVLDQLRKDLGITPAGQKNEYTRDIGQLLKGVAKVYSINAALSGAQRNQEAKLKTAKPEDVEAIKQQTADITAAQSKIAFSKGAQEVINIRNLFELETKGIDKLLELYGVGSTFDIKSKKGRENFIASIKDTLFPLFPKEFFFNYNKQGKVTNSVFTASNANYGLSMTNPQEAPIYEAFRNEIFELGKLDDSSFGKPIKGANWSLTKGYNTIFGTKDNYLKKMKDKKAIEQWNANVALIHEEMWSRFNTAISKDKTNKTAQAVGTYLKLVANDKQSWHRLGAQLAGYSKSLTKRKNGKAPTIEMEHAMPATAAYLYLMDAILSDNNFQAAYDLVIDNYKLIVLDKAMDDKLRNAKTKSGYSLQRRMPDDWSPLLNNWFERYFNDIVGSLDGGIDPNSIIALDGKTFAEKYNINTEGNPKIVKSAGKKPVISKAISNARPVKKYTQTSRGMSTFDFDETLIIDGENFVTATKDGETVQIPSDKWPIDGPRYAEEGWSFDFSDFVNVRGGKEGPLLQKMKNQIKKYGNKNVFVLTARMQEAAEPIHKWLKSKGIDIPIENITGLGKSEGDAKAQWFIDKYAEGYNDMYFVDDALPNVEAVKHVFDQLDVKGKSVQAKINFSKGMSSVLNEMIERTKGVGREKTFSRIGAQKRGRNIGKFAFFVPPSADDFAGLLRYFAGRGEQGNKDIAFFKKALLDPFARADRDMKEARQAIMDDYKALRKALPQVSKKLGKMVDKSGFTFDNAIRVYLWNKAGFEIPGLSKRDITFLSNVVETDQDLKTYAKTIGLISKQKDGYIKPSEYWDVESIASDLQNIVNKEGRKEYLAEWIENKNEIFSPENLNKIEAVYGSNFREALENILWRMENGTNRGKGMGRIEAKWNNWVNNSVGAIMFFNARSAVLQTLSTVNFINFEDNNIFAAAKAFANQKQYWKDFSFLFNSDFLKQRRAGLQSDINEAEIASAVAGAANKAKAALQYLLKIGFTPTQIADSFAIASGGATYYRNRVNKYVKEGMDQKAAEEQAMLDFQEIAEETQQSARPDRISQQQASSLGRIILAFANTPMQYARLIKKASVDLVKGRGDWRSNVSRIIYYGAAQNFIFTALQSALFALAFDDEEPEEDEIDKKTTRILNGMLDSLLRGSGLAGAVVSTIKNTIQEFEEQKEKKGRADYAYVLVEALNVSPPIGSKARKLYSGALKTYEYNGDVMGEFDTFDLENPLWTIVGNVVSATTNLPLDRAFRKIDNIKEALNQDNQTWQRIGLALGWDQWSLGVDPYKDIKEAEKRLRDKKREEKKKNQQRCTKIKSDGIRCKIMVNKPKTRCHYHD